MPSLSRPLFSYFTSRNKLKHPLWPQYIPYLNKIGIRMRDLGAPPALYTTPTFTHTTTHHPSLQSPSMHCERPESKFMSWRQILTRRSTDASNAVGLSFYFLQLNCFCFLGQLMAGQNLSLSWKRKSFSAVSVLSKDSIPQQQNTLYLALHRTNNSTWFSTWPCQWHSVEGVSFAVCAWTNMGREWPGPWEGKKLFSFFRKISFSHLVYYTTIADISPWNA